MTSALTPKSQPASMVTQASAKGGPAGTPRVGSPMSSVDDVQSASGHGTSASDSGRGSLHGNGAEVPVIPSRSSSPPAQTGLGSLSSEQQLVEALRSKDRLFVLGLGQDIESFIQRLLSASPDTLMDVKPLGVSAQSKFQRMLVYKAAEWYGLKAVAGGDGMVVIGLAMIGLNESSGNLRLASLVPREPSPPQMFRIMRRTPASSSSSNPPSISASTANGNGGISRSTSVSGDGLEGTAERKTMTIEEREREYAKVRMRIFQSGDGEARDDVSSNSGSIKGKEKDVGEGELAPERGRQQRAELRGESEDEEDPISRHAYTAKGWEEPIFASVYYQTAPPAPASVASSSSASVPPSSVHGHSIPPTPAYGRANYGPMPPGPYGQFGIEGPGPQYGLQTPTQQPYQLPRTHPHHAYPPGGRQQAWEAGGPLAMHYHSQHQQQGYYSEQQPQEGWGPQGYYLPQQEPYGYGPPPMPNYQGYPPNGYASSGVLTSPIPMRPSNYHHYSTASSSSISSRSVDGSRPHSRGSTTSSRSGGARMGAIYPAGAPGPGQRQRAMSKGMGLEYRRWSGGAQGGMSPERSGTRSGRGQSPASTTSSSSRSRRSHPLPTPLPGQHPLPNRPDWSANNIPYQPSPRPPPAPPTTADFPPLRGTGTDAIPMQAERAKIKPTPGVWDGSNPRKMLHPYPSQQQQQQHQQRQQQQHHHQQMQRQMQPQILANPNYHYQPPMPKPPMPMPPMTDDPDFPRRPVRPAGTLYDPSAAAAPSFPSTIATVGEPEGMTNEEIMEAKLAALAVSTGVVIGPPPSKQKQVQSYARIVRRE